MNTRQSIHKAYDDAADAYAEKFWDEIEKKNLDCILLRWVAGQVPASERILEIGCRARRSVRLPEQAPRGLHRD